jgi:hypothetical protein
LFPGGQQLFHLRGDRKRQIFSQFHLREKQVFWFSVNWKKRAGALRSGRVGFVV